MRRKRKGELGDWTMVVRGRYFARSTQKIQQERGNNWPNFGRAALVCAVLLSVPAGCGLDEKACNGLRSQAFDIVNEPHTCNDDLECLGSQWPGCAKPLSKKNRARVAPLQQQFEDGKCVEPKSDCREPPEIYCKQGLCVFNEKSIK